MNEQIAIDPERQAGLKKVVERLHGGAGVAEVKRDFAAVIHGASAAEIAAMEQALVDSGFPVEEIQRLCEVHVEVFESALQRGGKPSRMSGHPIHTFMAENRAAEQCVRRLRRAAAALGRRRLFSGLRGAGAAPSPAVVEEARDALRDLSRIVIHFERKENQLFPWLEKHGFTGPSRVMWSKHDEIRALLKEAASAFADDGGAFADGGAAAGNNGAAFRTLAGKLATAVTRMIFMEEHILYPEAGRRLSEAEWASIRAGEESIGFAWIKPGAEYDAAIAAARAGSKGAPTALEALIAATPDKAGAAAPIELNTGLVSAEVLDLALRKLPLDLSIVDETDHVLYYSDSADRIFPRSPAVIGRAVQNCHPQKSVAIVQRILDSFRAGTKDKARFWINMGGRFIVIEYTALRDAEGRYRGALESSQDATEIRSLEGEGRLLDWKD